MTVGFLFFDYSGRLCLSVDEVTFAPGHRILAVCWQRDRRAWGPLESVTYGDLAELVDIEAEDVLALCTVAFVPTLAEGTEAVKPRVLSRRDSSRRF